MSSLPENTVLTSRREYEAALTAVLAHAQHKLFIFDPDLTFGGFEAAENVMRLRDLLVRQPAAKVTLVLQDTRYLVDRCSRLLGLMRQYQHAMTVYETNDEGKRVSDSFVLADDHAYLRRFHVDQVRFKFRTILLRPDCLACGLRNCCSSLIIRSVLHPWGYEI